ncbi:MAG: outer membrane beta-barrel protein [Bacteroidales bacterium]|nr:outer membrane beta-barrel protein [Bacteroidales bacterium]
MRHSIRTITFFLALLVSIAASAQNQVSVTLKLIDSKTSDPVSFATVSLTVKGQEKPSKYVLSDSEGNAVLTKVSRNTYVLKAEIMGYKTYSQEIKVDKALNLGEIKIDEDVEVLDAARVTDVGNPIIIRKDTIEYTASSFKTSDNDMLEELLKKLPGVEVESDGSITANGETIKKITIDGKTFFLDDPQLASKNIPAKLIEKVKVVEKKSDQAIFTGIDDGEHETIIDLTMRPGMMQGWFGNVMGGGGHDVPGAGSDMNDWRYQGAAMVGRFTDKSQISLILNGNNTNNRGFNDMAGSMMQGMRGGGGGMGRGMGRGMGGWGRGNGITTSWMGGLNGAFTLFDGDMDLGSNYLYNGSINDVIEENSKITYLEDGSRLLNEENGDSRTMTQGHRFGVRLEHKFSDNTSILFEPQFNFGYGDFNEFSEFTTLTERGEVRDSTNRGYNSTSGANDNWSTSGFFLFRQRLGKPGRTISANVRYSFSDNNMHGFNQSMTTVYDLESGAKSDEKVNQRYDQNSKSASLSGRVVYTEPLGNGFFLETNYQYGWNQNTSFKDTYNSGSDNLVYDDRHEIDVLVYNSNNEFIDPTYSNRINNTSQSHRAGASFTYQKDKVRAQLGAAYHPTITDNVTSGHDPYHNVAHNWSPQASLNYEFNDNTNIRFFYWGRSAQPSTSQLLPVPDNSNPLNISLGNPNLNPYFNHNLRGNFGYTNKKTFTSVNARFSASLVEDAITNAQWYDPAGVQYSIPVNGPTTGSADLRVMVNSPFGKSGFSIFSMTFGRYNHSTSFIGSGALESEKYYDSEDASFDFVAFNRDYSDLSKSDDFVNNRTQTMSFTQRLRLTYRNDMVELTLGGRTRMNKSWYTMKNSQVQATWNNQVDASMNWTIPGGINLIADVDYNWYVGYTTPQEDEVILNAEFTKLLFKNKCTLALKAYDILGQSKNLSVSDSANYHMETRNNTLGRYIILSLTYRFGNFNGAKGGGRGPGGPGGPMRGPMGGRPF